jgi:hypothetical protein
MLTSYNKNLESINYTDRGKNFEKDSQCVWVVYPPGAAGDLVSAIINSHYIETGSRYFGISESGQVIFRPSDNKITNSYMNTYKELPVFDPQWFCKLADQLSEKNLSVSLLDQYIFSCHAYKTKDIEQIKESFPNSKIINIFCDNIQGSAIMKQMSNLKNNTSTHSPLKTYQQHCYNNVLNIPFGGLFNSTLYYIYYDCIIDFLGLPGRFVCFDYIQFYLSKQHTDIKNQLVQYSQSLLTNNINQ